MDNPYKEYLDEYFNILIKYRHTTSRLNRVLKSDVKIQTRGDWNLQFGSALVISDWTGPTENGWEVNFHTGAHHQTFKESYKSEVQNIISRECCLMYAQSFEALESFIKDCLFYKAKEDTYLQEYLISQSRDKNNFNREVMPSGDKLFKGLKKACASTFAKYSNTNNLNYNFSVFWSVLSDSRHAITHSQSIIKESKLTLSIHHTEIFQDLFSCIKTENNSIILKLDYHMFERIIKRLAEFGFQIYKALSIKNEIKS